MLQLGKMRTVIVLTVLTVFFKGADLLPLRGMSSYSSFSPLSYSSYYPSPYNSHNSFNFGDDDDDDDYDLDDVDDSEDDYDLDDGDDSENDSDFDDSDDDEDTNFYQDNSYGSFNVINNRNVSPQLKNGKLYVNGKMIVDVKVSDRIDIIKNKVYKNDKFICSV